MAAAIWVVAAILFTLWAGTWLIQIALWVLIVALHLLRGAAVVLFGLIATVVLAIFDRKTLRRAWSP